MRGTSLQRKRLNASIRFRMLYFKKKHQQSGTRHLPEGWTRCRATGIQIKQLLFSRIQRRNEERGQREQGTTQKDISDKEASAKMLAPWTPRSVDTPYVVGIANEKLEGEILSSGHPHEVGFHLQLVEKRAWRIVGRAASMTGPTTSWMVVIASREFNLPSYVIKRMLNEKFRFGFDCNCTRLINCKLSCFCRNIAWSFDFLEWLYDCN